MRVLAINNNILNFSGLYVKNKNPNAPIKENSPKNIELRANPADIFIAYKTKTPSEVKTSIKDFLAANERGVDFHINMLSSIQAGFEAAHKTTGEIYSNDDYIKTLIEQFNPKNVISFFEQGSEFDLDGNLKKKITKNKDGSIQIDYFSPDGKIERTTKTDRRGEWLEVVEGLETEKDGTQKIQKKYLFNLYENRLESYEEGIEISPLGDVKIQKEVNSKGVFSKSGKVIFIYANIYLLIRNRSVSLFDRLFRPAENRPDISPMATRRIGNPSYLHRTGRIQFSHPPRRDKPTN